MSNLEIQEMLSFIDTNGLDGFDDDRIEKLERIIDDCNDRLRRNSDSQIADSIYDTLYSALKVLKPESGLLSQIWEEDGDITDYTDLLVKNPMMSIETVKSYTCNELKGFLDRVPDETSYIASYKINGHGIRVVYEDGYLVSATSRARSSAGRDITRHMKILLGDGYNEHLAKYGMVELRGEICLKLENLDKAREFNPTIKSAFSAVASLIKPSASEEEIKLLDFLCYGFIVEDFHFNTKEDEFLEIQEAGFSTPNYFLIESSTKEELLDNIKYSVEIAEEEYEEYGYFCDGLVFELNDTEEFRALGTEGNHNLGNIALKVGVWEQVQYCGIVNKIIWTKGKTKLSPVALISEDMDILEDDDGNVLNMEDLGVLTAQGNKVRRVPLYEPKNMLILEAYEGNPIFFRYGGEAGVIPCFPDGRLLKEDAAKEILTGEEEYVF